MKTPFTPVYVLCVYAGRFRNNWNKMTFSGWSSWERENEFQVDTEGAKALLCIFHQLGCKPNIQQDL